MNLISFEFTPRSEISGSYSSSSLKIFRTIHTVLHKDCTNLHLYQECRRILVSPHCQHLLSLVSLIIANLTGKQWYFIVVLVFISLMISDIEHLWYACMSALENVYSCPLLIFKHDFYCCWVVWVSYIFYIVSDAWFGNISPVPQVAFSFCWLFSMPCGSLLVWCSAI